MIRRRKALERYVTSAPSTLERIERLEQLRAFRIGLSVGVRIVHTNPLGVDTEADLAEARRWLADAGIAAGA